MMAAVLAESLPLLYGAFVLWGLYFELASSAAEAVFADSVPLGQRGKSLRTTPHTWHKRFHNATLKTFEDL